MNQDITQWLPISKKEVELRGWTELDVILFTGDAYIDHPAFGAAVIGRILESEGLRVAVVPQPNWRDDLRDFTKLGRPRLFFGITAGAMDSMVNHYTANLRRRSTDAYTPGNKSGMRPDYAVKVYSQIVKRLFPDVPVIIGGIEASLRRLTHFDYWSDKLMPSVLVDSGADLLVHGMGDKIIRDIARLMKRGVPLENVRNSYQTGYLLQAGEELPAHKKWETIELASHDNCLNDKLAYARNFKHIEQESNKTYAARIVQRVGEQLVVINPQFPHVSEKEVDQTYDLPYTRLPHPRYAKKGEIPAFEMIKFSVNSHRGCFGGCAFCTISAHQGKSIISRSEASILREVEQITEMPDFKGYLSDVGGPSANMYRMQGKDLSVCDQCVRPSCLHPKVCKNLDTSHRPILDLYAKIRENPKVKKAFVGSGIRYDLFIDNEGSLADDPSHREYLETIVTHHVSGRLKVAPEHSSDKVLHVMRKPSFKLFHKMKREFERINTKAGLNQQLIPYFISSHPGSTGEAMAELAVDTKELGFNLEQIQDFTPTPMTVATVIYYSGVHPYTLKPMYTPRNQDDKRAQRRFFFWYKPEFQKEIAEDLKKMNRKDLADKLFDAVTRRKLSEGTKKSERKSDHPASKSHSSAKNPHHRSQVPHHRRKKS